jgi:hypothetical protein
MLPALPVWCRTDLSYTVSDVKGDVRSAQGGPGRRIRRVYLAFTRDESVMGFAFPKEERDWLVGGSPDKFMQPSKSDLRYHWVDVRLAAIDVREMRELVLDAWRMVVPKSVAAGYDESMVSPRSSI